MNILTIFSIFGAAGFLVALLLYVSRMPERDPNLERPKFALGRRVEHPVHGCGTIAADQQMDGLVLVSFDGSERPHLVAVWTLTAAPAGKATPFVYRRA